MEQRSVQKQAETAAKPQSLRYAYRIDFLNNPVFIRLVLARFVFLLGIFGVGRFLLFYTDEELGLGSGETGALLGLFAVLSAISSPVFGRLADLYGRLAVMRSGMLLAATGIVLFIPAHSLELIVLAGSFMGLGSAAFGAGNWAATTDALPAHEAGRFMGIANFGTAGASAAAGLFGPIIDIVDRTLPVSRFDALFLFSVVSVGASTLVMRGAREVEPGRMLII